MPALRDAGDQPAPTARTLVRGSLALGLLLVLAAAVLLAKATLDPEVPLLLRRGGASWIGVDQPFELRARAAGLTAVELRTAFELPSRPDGPLLLHVRAYRAAAVYVGGERVASLDTLAPGRWRQILTVDLARVAKPGRQVLRLLVINRDGPALAQAWAPALGLRSDGGWEARRPDGDWAPAALAERRAVSTLGRRFGTAVDALRALLPVLVPLFLVVLLAGFAAARSRSREWMQGVGALRWFLLLVVVALGAVGMWRVPLRIGFDLEAHLEYVATVAAGRLPLPDEGWQSFQAPLYYLLSAPLLLALREATDAESALRWLRLVPVLASVVQVELAYRGGRLVFPRRPDLQAVALLIGGLLPMNLYMARYVSNEPLAGALGAAAIVATWARLAGRLRPGVGSAALLGVLWGLAVLAKVSALLLGPPLLAALAVACRWEARGWRAAVRELTTCGAAAALVSGWFFARNWLLTGTPLFTRSDNIVWWQDPGYRTPEHFLGFGPALRYPVLASAAGLWDSLYSTLWLDGALSSVASWGGRPPWNYSPMLAGALLAAVPTVALVVGVVRSLGAPPARQPLLAFAVGCLAIYVAALAWLYLHLPIYTTAKASYTLALTPVYGVLAAAGLEPLLRRPLARAVVFGWLVCWAACVAASYFVLA